MVSLDGEDEVQIAVGTIEPVAGEKNRIYRVFQTKIHHLSSHGLVAIRTISLENERDITSRLIRDWTSKMWQPGRHEFSIKPKTISTVNKGTVGCSRESVDVQISPFEMIK
jgi:hypothetical protein